MGAIKETLKRISDEDLQKRFRDAVVRNDSGMFINCFKEAMRRLNEQTPVKGKKKVMDICKAKGINIDLLTELFQLRAQGFQTIEIAPKLGIHRVTVSRYISTLKKMKESEFKSIYDFIIRRHYNENQKSHHN